MDFEFDDKLQVEGDSIDKSEGTKELSQHAMVVDGWAAMTGERLADSEIAHCQLRDDDGNGVEPNEHHLADAYVAAYEADARTCENASDPAAKAWWDDFMSTPEARKMRESTMHNHDMSVLVVWSLVKELQGYLADAPEDAGTEDESFETSAGRLRSVRKAAQQAADDAETLEACGIGMEQGEGSSFSREDLVKTYRLAKQSSRLVGILQSAGRMIQYANARRKEKIFGFDNIEGITISGEVANLLPSELGLLADEDREIELMRKLAEKQAISVLRNAEVKAGRGPVVVVLDESGSMNCNNNIVHAKAFALTLAWLAKQDKRWICLIGFSSAGQRTRLTMPPNKWNQAELLQWCEHFYSGGTDYNVLREVAHQWDDIGAPKGKTDIVFITDDSASFSDQLVAEFTDFKKREQVECYGIAVDSDVADMPLVCDHTSSITSFTMDESSVKKVLEEI